MTEQKRRFSLDERIKCVRREIALRTNVYPGQVARKKMRQAEADYELGCMEAILGMLELMKGNNIPAEMPRPADLIAALVHVRTLTVLSGMTGPAVERRVAEIRKIVEDVLTGMVVPKLKEGEKAE